MKIKGIDVSFWQPKIDWVKVKNSGVKFAILRAAYGTSLDSKFNEHAKNAIATGIDIGAYVYSIATTTSQAVREADFILNAVKPYQLNYPIVFDMESKEIASVSKEMRTQIAIAFCERIEKAGYYVMIYANKYWLDSQLDFSKLKAYDVWLAQWTAEPSWNGNYGIWQSGQTDVDGVGYCDINEGYRDYPQIMKDAGLNGYKKDTTPNPPTAPEKPEPQPPTEPDKKPVVVGAKVRYKGLVQYSSWGKGGKPISVDGTFVIQRIIKDRKYGVQIDQLGWIAEEDCDVI